MKPHVYSTLILFALIAITTSYRFSLDSSTPSLSLTFDVKGTQTFTAVSSGQEYHDVNILIEYTARGMSISKIIYNKTINDASFTYDYEEGYINVTITSSTDSNRNVSFDFYSEDDPLVKMIDKKDLKYVEGVLTSVFKGLGEVSRNQQFHIQRDQSHKVTLEQSESSIKWTGIIKIIFLLSSALIQLWIMKGFFKGNQSQPYQPVEM